MSKWGEKNQKIMRILRGAQGRCKYHSPRNTKCYIEKGIKCELTYDDVLMLWRKYKASSMVKPSLDRLNENENYNIKNCRIIEWVEHRNISLEKMHEARRNKTKIPIKIKDIKIYIENPLLEQAAKLALDLHLPKSKQGRPTKI